MKSRYDRKTEYVFGGASSFWFVFVAAALLVWLSPLFAEQESSSTRTMLLGAAALLFGLCLRFSYYGTQIDPEKKKIREYTSLMCFKAGDWKNLPDLKKIRLTSYKVSSRNTPNGISPTLQYTSTCYTIALFAHAATPDYVITTENKEQALKDASTLSSLLYLLACFT